MPELPDVEVYKKYLDATALHRRVSHVSVGNKRVLENIDPNTLQQRLARQRFEETHRHGKYLFVHLDHGWLYLHFGMTGYLEFQESKAGKIEHERVGFDFDDGSHLGFSCQRMFGKLGLTESVEELLQEKNLGPDALAINPDAFRAALGSKRGVLKTALMDQSTLAGIGNVYSDEILYQAGLHPETAVDKLSSADFQDIYDTLQNVLAKAIEWQADPAQFAPSFLLPHRHADGHCPKDDHPLQTLKAGGRTAYFCPACQHR